ncbi:S-adenosylmethionine decarboxylase, partial [Bacillus pseudomycoides]
DLNNYLFGYTQEKLSVKEQEEITKKLKTEMDEIFYGKNMSHGLIEEDLDDEL